MLPITRTNYARAQFDDLQFDDLQWEEVTGSKRDDVARQARRYCPDFPFATDASIEQVSNLELFYTDDYRLVRISSAEPTRRQVWGFYAPGDFHPLDGAGRVFEELNRIAPLSLNRETVLDYALLRLRFELPARLLKREELLEFRPAKIVSSPEELLPEGIPPTDKKLKDLAPPRVVMAPEWEDGASSSTQRGLVFRVIAFAVVYSDETHWQLVQALVQIEPDGMFTLARLSKEQRIAKGRRPATEPETPLVLTTRRTRTAMPIQEWRVLRDVERDNALSKLLKYDIGDSQGEVVLRQARLPFYRSCELLEVLVPGEPRYRRSYALIQTEADEIRPLSGASADIHAINEQENQLDLNPDTVNDYLRFFCWAIHSDGPFYVPSAFREIPLLAAPSKSQREELNFEFKISPVDEAEAATLLFETTGSEQLRKAHVVYVSGMFEAWFAIERTGMVRMLADEPLVSDLVIYKEKYAPGTEDLFTLQEVSKPEPRFVSELTLFNKIIFIEQIPELQQRWSRLTPPDDEIVSTSAPEVIQPLRRILEQLSEEGASINDALKFLKAQVSQSAQDQKITPNAFLKSLDELVTEMRPQTNASSRLFSRELADKAKAVGLNVNEEILLDQNSVSWQRQNDPKTSDSERHIEQRISDCWFQRLVRLTTLPEIALVFERCVFEQGLLAEGAKIGRALKFVDCVFKNNGQYSVNLENASLSGPLVLSRCKLMGKFFAPGLRAQSHIQLLGCGISSNLSAINENRTVSWMLNRKWPDPEGEFEQDSIEPLQAINLVGARIEGTLKIGSRTEDLDHNPILEPEASMIYGSIEADDIVVGQKLDLSGTSCQKAISFTRAQVASTVSFRSFRTLEGTLSLARAKIESDVILNETNVNGDVVLYLTTVDGNLTLLGLRTTGNLNLVYGQFRAFVAAFHQVSFSSLPSLSVGGDLIMSGAQARVIELRGAEITGKIQLITGKFGRLILGLDTSPVTTSGQTNTSAVRFAPKPCRARVVELTSIEVEGNLDLSGLVVGLPDDERNASRLRMDNEGTAILLNNSRIGRDLTFFTERVRSKLERRWKEKDDQRLPWKRTPFPHDYQSMTWGNLVLKANEIDGELDLRNLNVKGDIYLSHTRVRFDVNMEAGDPYFDRFRTQCKNMRAEKLDCSGDLKLSGIRVSENFRARQAKVKGEIVFLPSQTKELMVNAEEVMLDQESVVAKIKGDLDLSSVEVSGDLDLRNLEVGGDILLNDSTVGRDLNMDGNSFPCHATTCNDVNAEGLKCNGEMKLSGLCANGDFRGRDIQVGSDITFLATVNPGNNGGQRNGNRPVGYARIGGYVDLTAAKANRLTLSGNNLCSDFRVQDLDLVRLTNDLRKANDGLPQYLKSKMPDTKKMLENGGKNAELEKALLGELNKLLPGECLFERKRFAKVQLSSETRRHLNEKSQDNTRLNRRLLEDSYPIDPQNRARVRLERSQIGHLEIMKPPVLGRANLSGISVTHWVFSESNNNGRDKTASADDYIDLLHESTPFDRSTWIDVERALRNQSLVGDANKVYREMRRRIKNDTSAGPLLSSFRKGSASFKRVIPDRLASPFKTLVNLFAEKYNSFVKPTLWHAWDRSQSIFIGYSTRVWIPMVPAMLFFIISMFIFCNQEYVRASPSLLQVLTSTENQVPANQVPANQAPVNQAPVNQAIVLERPPYKVSGAHWSWSDGLVLTFRYHVPILTSLTHSWWEASSKPLFWNLTAEHYAFLVQIYSWIAWPIFLLGAAAQVFRGKQN